MVIIMKTKALALTAMFAPAALILSETLAFTAGSSTNTSSTAVQEMDTLLAEIITWINGPLGSLLAVGALIVGLAVGIMQQSAMAAVVGIAFAAVVAYGPNIVQGIAGFAEEVL